MISSRAARSVSRPNKSSCPRTLGMLSKEKLSSLPSAGRSSSIPAIRGGGESLAGHCGSVDRHGDHVASGEQQFLQPFGIANRPRPANDVNVVAQGRFAHQHRNGFGFHGIFQRHGKRGELLEGLARPGLVGEPTANQAPGCSTRRGRRPLRPPRPSGDRPFPATGPSSGEPWPLRTSPARERRAGKAASADRSSAAWESRRND